MADKISTGITYIASATLIGMGSAARWLISLDWNLISVVGGLLLGVLTFWVNLHFKKKQQRAIDRQTEAYEEVLKRGYALPPLKTLNIQKDKPKWRK